MTCASERMKPAMVSLRFTSLMGSALISGSSCSSGVSSFSAWSRRSSNVYTAKQIRGKQVEKRYGGKDLGSSLRSVRICQIGNKVCGDVLAVDPLRKRLLTRKDDGGINGDIARAFEGERTSSFSSSSPKSSSSPESLISNDSCSFSTITCEHSKTLSTRWRK